MFGVVDKHAHHTHAPTLVRSIVQRTRTGNRATTHRGPNLCNLHAKPPATHLGTLAFLVARGRVREHPNSIKIRCTGAQNKSTRPRARGSRARTRRTPHSACAAAWSAVPVPLPCRACCPLPAAEYQPSFKRAGNHRPTPSSGQPRPRTQHTLHAAAAVAAHASIPEKARTLAHAPRPRGAGTRPPAATMSARRAAKRPPPGEGDTDTDTDASTGRSGSSLGGGGGGGSAEDSNLGGVAEDDGGGGGAGPSSRAGRGKRRKMASSPPAQPASPPGAASASSAGAGSPGSSAGGGSPGSDTPVEAPPPQSPPSRFLPFESALVVARGLHLRGEKGWRQWCVRASAPPPPCPCCAVQAGRAPSWLCARPR